MKISNLSDHTRLELHNQIKKNIRKYYKGLKSGSLRYDSFVNSILTKNPKPGWLKENPNLENDKEFADSLVQYIKNAITRYAKLEEESKYNSTVTNRVLSEKSEKINNDNVTMAMKERQELKKILDSKGYTLSIPTKFITTTESKYLMNYITNGTPIPLGWEKVLNYIKKTT